MTNKEKRELISQFRDKVPFMSAEYRQLIKHTGGLLSESMTVAYSRALNDTIKFLTNLEATNDEKPVQKTEEKA